MRTKSFLFLLVVTAISVAAAAAAVHQRESRARLAEVPSALYPGLVERVNEVVKATVVTPEDRFTVVKKEGGRWEMVEKGGYPVPFETVKQTVVGIASLTPLEAKTARPERFHKIRVLDPSSADAVAGKGTLIRLIGENDAEIAAIIVGKSKSIQTTARDGWFYVRKPDQNQSWLASGRLEVFDKASRWLDTEIVTVSRKRVRAATTIQPDGATVTVSRPSPDKTDFTVEDLPEGAKEIHETVSNKLGSALGFISFEDVKPIGEIAFSGPTQAVFRTFDGLVIKVDTVELDAKHWLRFKAEFDPDGVRLEGVLEENKGEMKAAEEVQEEAEKINRRFGVWAYHVPKYKAEDLVTPSKKLIYFEEDKGKP